MEHTSNITATILKWTAPDNDDLAWYRIYRITANNTTLLTDGNKIAEVANCDNPHFIYVHTNLGEGWTRWYYIRAVSFGGNSGAFSVAMSATRTSGMTISGPLHVSGNVTLGGTLNVSGAVSISNTLWTCGDATFNDTVNIMGATSVSDTLHVCGAVTFGTTLDVSGNVTIGGTLKVSGLASFDAIKATGGMTVIGTLTVDNLIVTGGISVHGGLLVSASSVFGASLSVSGDTTIGGDAVVCGTLTVSGITTLESTHIGGGTNYIGIESGRATYYGDARSDVCKYIHYNSLRKGVSSPDSASKDGFPIYDFDDTNDEEVFYMTNIDHGYNESGAVSIEIKFFVDTAPATDKIVRWGCEYKKISPGDVFSFTADTSTVYDDTIISSGITDQDVILTEKMSFTTTGWMSEDTIMMRFFRNGSHLNDTYVGDARLMMIHKHILVNSMGRVPS